MYPKDKKTAALMSETIREVLTNESLYKSIINNSEQVPDFVHYLPTENGITAMTVALMIKAMGGDVAAFTALSKYGFGEKVQMEVSDFYRTGKIDIQVVKPPELESSVSPSEVGLAAHEAITKALAEGETVDGDRESSENEAGASTMEKSESEQ